MLATVESFQLTEEPITLTVLPPCPSILSLFIILVNILKLLFAFLSAPLVPKLRKFPATMKTLPNQINSMPSASDRQSADHEPQHC